MRKTSDISKFDIHWQVLRVSLKKLPLEQKLETASGYFFAHRNRADQERVLNYLEGLGMAYKGFKRDLCRDKRESLAIYEVTDINECSYDYARYSHKELHGVLINLMARAKNWLDNGYRNTELIDFIIKLGEYLEDTKQLKRLQDLIDYSYTIKNTHKFFF